MTGEESIPFWLFSLFVVIGFFVLAACLRPVIGKGFDWTCWRPERWREKEWNDEDDDDPGFLR